MTELSTVNNASEQHRRVVRQSIMFVMRRIGAFALMTLALLLLKAPVILREILFLACAFFCFWIAVRAFAQVWLVILLLLPIIHVAGIMFGFPQLTLVRILLIGMTIFVLLHKKPGDYWKSLFKQPGFVWFILFILGNLLSAFRVLRVDAVFRAISYLEPLLFYLLAYTIVRINSQNLPRLLRVVIIGGIFVIALGFLEMALQKPIFDLLQITETSLQEEYSVYMTINRFGLGGRIMSTVGQPVYASMYFTIWLLVSVFYVITFRPGLRYLLFILVPLGILAILATGTLGSLLSLVPALIVFILLNPGKKQTLILLGLGAFFVAVLSFRSSFRIFDYLQAALATGSGGQESLNAAARIKLTLDLLNIFRQNLVFGYGPGVIQTLGLQGVEEFSGFAGLENQYAAILADGGLLAAIPYFFFILSTLSLFRRLYSSGEREIKLIGLMMLVIFTYYFVMVISVSSLMALPNLVIMSLYGAIVATYGSSPEYKRYTDPFVPKKNLKIVKK